MGNIGPTHMKPRLHNLKVTFNIYILKKKETLLIKRINGELSNKYSKDIWVQKIKSSKKIRVRKIECKNNLKKRATWRYYLEMGYRKLGKRN